MSSLIDNDIKDRVRSAIEIVDLVGSYVQLHRRAAHYVGLCPFHDDSNPSFTVNPVRQIWRCFVCAKGGDIFSFIMEKERVAFPEALHMLADRAGIEIPVRKKRGKSSSNDFSSIDAKKSLYDAMAWACREYHQYLCSDPKAEPARSYLAERGLTQESIERYQIGFAPEEWSWLVERASQRAISAATLAAIGVSVQHERGSYYDRFRGRVLFPICDPQGRPISIGGRVLPGDNKDQAKYVNCNETRLYSKSHQLYGLDIARQHLHTMKTAIVMEGYTDVIMANQYGVRNGVAVCGTALGEGHLRLLKRYCESVILLLDGDEAGQKRTSEVLELFLTAQLDLRIATLPDELDPCDFLLTRGQSALQAILDGSVDAMEFKLRSVCSGIDTIRDTHRATNALEQMLELLAKVPRQRLSSHESSRLRLEQVLVRLSRQFGIEVSTLKARLEQMRQASAKRISFRSRRDEQDANPDTGSIATGSLHENDRRQTNPSASKQRTSGYTGASIERLSYASMTAMDRELFEILVLHPNTAAIAIERFSPEQLQSTTAHRLWDLYVDLEMNGHSLDFDSVMCAVEDLETKSLLVELEEEASEKEQFIQIDPDKRFEAICERIEMIEQSQLDQMRMRELESRRLEEDDELRLLKEVLEQARTKRPTFPIN